MSGYKKKNTKNVAPVTKPLTLWGVLRNIIWFMGVCAVGFGIFFSIAQIGIYFDRKEIKKIKTNEGTAEGLIIKTGSMKGSYVIAEYLVNGKRYEKQEGSYADDIQKGQRFKILYDKADPSLSRIAYDKPFFVENDMTSTTQGTIVTVDSYTLRFEYAIGGRQYRKFQKYPEGEVFSEGESYTVEYLVNDPYIAILRIP